MAKTPRATSADPDAKNDIKAAGMGKFTFQFQNDKCQQVTLMSLKDSQTVRPIWSSSLIVKSGGSVAGTASIPDLPGQDVTVDPKTRTVTITDPLGGDQSDKLEALNRVAASNNAIVPAGGRSYRAAPDREMTLSADEFKTFMSELNYYANHGKATTKLVMQGGSVFPSEKQIERLDGRMLYDPRTNSRVQPKFADQVDDWHQKLAMRGS